MTTCKCGLVPFGSDPLNAWLGKGYRDGRWHSMARCGTRCGVAHVDEPGVTITCTMVADHDGDHFFPGLPSPQQPSMVACLVHHTDEHGRTIPCPGYPHPEPRDEAQPPPDPQDGDWVLIYGQIEPMTKDRTPRPEEVNVRLQSHGEDYHALVSRRFLHSVTTAPPDWPRCSSVLMPSDMGGVLIQCTRSHNHPMPHRGQGDRAWDRRDAYGDVEENPWR